MEGGGDGARNHLPPKKDFFLMRHANSFPETVFEKYWILSKGDKTPNFSFWCIRCSLGLQKLFELPNTRHCNLILVVVSCGGGKTKSTPTPSNWCSVGIVSLEWSLTLKATSKSWFVIISLVQMLMLRKANFHFFSLTLKTIITLNMLREKTMLWKRKSDQ